MSRSGNPSVLPRGENNSPLIGLEVTNHSPASVLSPCILALGVIAEAAPNPKTITSNARILVSFAMTFVSDVAMKYQSTDRSQALPTQSAEQCCIPLSIADEVWRAFL
jgi:hypothetical protein